MEYVPRKCRCQKNRMTSECHVVASHPAVPGCGGADLSSTVLLYFISFTRTGQSRSGLVPWLLSMSLLSNDLCRCRHWDGKQKVRAFQSPHSSAKTGASCVRVGSSTHQCWSWCFPLHCCRSHGAKPSRLSCQINPHLPSPDSIASPLPSVDHRLHTFSGHLHFKHFLCMCEQTPDKGWRCPLVWPRDCCTG